jgi:hypothetical protein
VAPAFGLPRPLNAGVSRHDARHLGELAVTSTTRIARVLGPTLVVVAITEWLNRDVFAAAAGPLFGPHVYLNGLLLFVAGLAILTVHNVWVRAWPVLVTIVGWLLVTLGLTRMISPLGAQAAGANPLILYGSLLLLLAVGGVLTVKGFSRNGTDRHQ